MCSRLLSINARPVFGLCSHTPSPSDCAQPLDELYGSSVRSIAFARIDFHIFSMYSICQSIAFLDYNRSKRRSPLHCSPLARLIHCTHNGIVANAVRSASALPLRNPSPPPACRRIPAQSIKCDGVSEDFVNKRFVVTELGLKFPPHSVAA